MSETFDRVEKKYLLDKSQYEDILSKIQEFVEPDKFFDADIRSIYYDNDSFQMIRRSIEKPDYKEKIRIRSYGEPLDDDMVFVEFKKKLNGVVYKRRTKAKYSDLLDNIKNAEFKDEQIGNEIKYAIDYYGGVKPAIYIGCNRTSYSGKDNKRLRITFDKDLRYRMKHLALKSDVSDQVLSDKIIMEIKAEKAMPLWLTKILDEAKAYPRGFSKVGTAFEKQVKEMNNHE